jgi:hypothetical protein
MDATLMPDAEVGKWGWDIFRIWQYKQAVSPGYYPRNKKNGTSRIAEIKNVYPMETDYVPIHAYNLKIKV